MPVRRDRPINPEDFWSKVDVGDPESCWHWRRGCFTAGYGQYRNLLAHRVAYALLYGPIPAGLVIDHTCHNEAGCTIIGKDCPHKKCVNPAHLVPKTTGANLAASPNTNGNKIHCAHGHEFTEENTYVRPDKKRACRECARITDQTERRRDQRRARRVRMKEMST